MTATDAPEWPSDRGNYSGIILQFGRTRADLLQWALGTADPLADAVVDELRIPSSPPTDAVIGAAIGQLRARRAEQRRNPAKWAGAISDNVAATRQLLGQADPALYEYDQ